MIRRKHRCGNTLPMPTHMIKTIIPTNIMLWVLLKCFNKNNVGMENGIATWCGIGYFRVSRLRVNYLLFIILNEFSSIESKRFQGNVFSPQWLVPFIYGAESFETSEGFSKYSSIWHSISDFWTLLCIHQRVHVSAGWTIEIFSS